MAKLKRGAVAGLATAGVAAALTVTLIAVGNGGGGGGSAHAKAAPRSTQPPVRHAPTTGATPKWDGKTKVIGDGSTSYTGPQPNQPSWHKLKPGEKPPQFVVFSWDGALEGDDHDFSRFRTLAKQYHANMTFFLSGIYLLPKDKRTLYHPPQHPPGSSAIDFPTDQHITWTIEQLRQAWEDGDEIGTHFNGHFCKPDKGAGANWSTKEWLSEADQAYSFVQNWKTNTGDTDIPPLPFDYAQELVGGRAPCLEGQKNLLPAEKQLGWRYDASSPGDFQLWPAKKDGVWNFPLELVPYPGKSFQGLSMDFNFLYNQSGGDVTEGDPAKYPAWEKQTRQGYLDGFERVYNGSRAPLFIGNHFEDWNGGIYMQAVADVVKDVCTKKGVECVSFKELCDWLDLQDPAVVAKLRNLDPGESPDWSTFLTK
ncbi:hypothetical protein SAMN05216223_10524 [Actinacidiphila yanglinensis]|uniref:Lipoprotein n=1 Tax=Actinacidiphila yanglinensis TaxID=310779 RepID=A0A1H5ZWG8_9ACTN|nr:hypothetical protein [Actinacidiphila yanglinensis]SEG40848.1 hypothetical protein SAMN05216223_10524 [Actinacidiphila yanglinensis]